MESPTGSIPAEQIFGFLGSKMGVAFEGCEIQQYLASAQLGAWHRTSGGHTRLLWTSPFMRLCSSHLQCVGVVGQLGSSEGEALYRNFGKCHNTTPLISHYSC